VVLRPKTVVHAGFGRHLLSDHDAIIQQGGVRYACMHTQFIVCGGGEKVQRVAWGDGGGVVECGVKPDQYQAKAGDTVANPHTRNRNREKE